MQGVAIGAACARIPVLSATVLGALAERGEVETSPPRKIRISSRRDADVQDAVTAVNDE